MISNQILQNTIDGVKGITKIDLSVVDADGNVLAETAGDSEDYCATVKIFADSPADSQAILGYQFLRFMMRAVRIHCRGKGRGRGCIYDWKDCCIPDSELISCL